MNELLPAVELALSKAWGASVTLSLQEMIANRRHVARLKVESSLPDIPKTVILKGWRSEEDEGFDPHSFDTALLNEWAGLEFTAQIFGKGALSPQVYAGDKEKGFLLIEDLPEGSTIEKILHGDNLAQAEEALIAYGEGLGKLHAQTIGHLESFYALRTSLGHPDSWAAYDPLPIFESVLRTLESLNFAVPPRAYSDAQLAAAHLSQLEGFLALHHGDPAPNNAWLDKTGRFYFFDFESAHFDHALFEGVNPRMGFPTWGMAFANRIPEKLWRQAETTYLKALSVHCPQAADARLYGPIIAAACALWTVGFCGRWLETALHAELPPEKRNRIRQVAISRIEAFVQASQEFNSLPVLGETFAKILETLRSQWPIEAQELPLFPVFQDSK